MKLVYSKLLRSVSFVSAAAGAVFAFAACSIGSGGGGTSGPSITPVVAYCPYIATPKTYSSPVTVTGSAFYEFRSNGNGPVADSVHTITVPSTQLLGTNYGFTVTSTTSTPIAFTCDITSCSPTYAAGKIAAVVTATTASPVSAVASGATIKLTPKNEGDPIAISATTLVTDSPDSYAAPNNITHPDPNPIRFAEVQVTDSSGAIVQCAETTGTGSFTFQVPAGSYTVAVMSRSNNSTNTGYVLSDPYNNTVYKVTSTLNTATPTVRVVAKVAVNAGAFNILDQIAKAQNFLRTQTAGCATTYADCDPFSIAPVISVFWSPGVTPSTYSGGTGGISFYGSPDGSAALRGLYILGGIGGDIDNSDMDHFDNSVIVHEYGHFIEDNFGRMDSPGGSHNGNGIIDARLAWGEGWADFFQGAVLSFYAVNNSNVACNGTSILCGNGFYRDTYGHVGCSGSNAQGLPGCTGASFNEDLSVDPNSCSGCHDVPQAVGEGDFREFSIARIMYKAIRPAASAVSIFNEIWTVLHGPSNGMKLSANRFKGIGQLHAMEIALTNSSKWQTLRTQEMHYGDLGDYSTPFDTTSCATTSQAMSIRVQCISSDDGSFSQSDQMRNNDFIRYTHPGGPLALSLNWSGTGKADLDLYVYPQGYVFGSGWSAASRADSNTTSGSESINTNLPAGNYIINVMAYTGKIDASHPSAPYSNPSCGSPLTAATTYNLTVNGSPLCLNYTKDPAR